MNHESRFMMKLNSFPYLLRQHTIRFFHFTYPKWKGDKEKKSKKGLENCFKGNI